MNKKLFLLGALASLCLVGCGGQTEEEDNTVDVFILSGQSNMEGSTYYDNGKNYLRNYMESVGLDPEPCFDGIDSVLCSHYGYYPYGGKPADSNINCSNKENPMAGKFIPTKVGMGNNKDLMGPELGLAYTLMDNNYANEDNPVRLIKCAFSGSGFASQSPNWVSRDESGLYHILKTYVYNNLKLIEDEGKVPVIKGFLWHQGESDSNSKQQGTDYLGHLEKLVGDFREEFKDYAPDQDGDNIAFIDALVFDGRTDTVTYSNVEDLNNSKLAFAEESDMNFCINTSTHREGGLNLVIGGGASNSDVDGCFNMYHYKTPDCFKLGEAYANVIMENDLI